MIHVVTHIRRQGYGTQPDRMFRHRRTVSAERSPWPCPGMDNTANHSAGSPQPDGHGSEEIAASRIAAPVTSKHMGRTGGTIRSDTAARPEEAPLIRSPDKTA